tara:strand:+ start:420 stop:977 length:558 start_codon:yes stop_codon:yes gene_type:complete
MSEELISDVKSNMANTIEYFQEDISGMRTNRAHSGLVSGLMVDYHGTQMKLSELGQISVSEGSMILIQLWDKSAVPSIAKEIESSDLGISPGIEGDTIRLVVPPLNEERRMELVRSLKKKSEDAKISIRNVRRNGMDEVKLLEKSSEISQDDSRRLQSEIQKNTDDNIDLISSISQEKENELMEV